MHTMLVMYKPKWHVELQRYKGGAIPLELIRVDAAGATGNVHYKCDDDHCECEQPDWSGKKLTSLRLLFELPLIMLLEWLIFISLYSCMHGGVDA